MVGQRNGISDVTLKINGQITFVWTGLENVQQMDSDGPSAQKVVGGIESGQAQEGGTFIHAFTEAGTYFFSSYVHQTLRIKVTVKDCKFCRVISGYRGSSPRNLLIATSSQTPGKYELHINNYAHIGLLTVYAGQNVTLHGGVAPVGQLPLLDGTIRVLARGALTLDSVHVGGGVTVDRAGVFRQPRTNVVSSRPTATFGEVTFLIRLCAYR